MDTTRPHSKTIMSLIRLKNAKSWRPQGFRPLYVSTFGFVAAFGLRYALAPFVEESLSMLFFAVNCIVMSYLFGYLYSLGLLAISIPRPCSSSASRITRWTGSTTRTSS